MEVRVRNEARQLMMEMKIMKTTLKALLAVAALLAISGTASARDHVSFGLSIGVPAPVYVAPPAYYAPPPVVYAQPQAYYAQPQGYYAPPAPVYPYPYGYGYRGREWHHHRHYR